MAALPGNLDPITLQTILKSLPEIQKRKRRAEQLRGYKASSEELMRTKSGNSNYTRTVNGGLYETVGKYIPDYETMGNKIAGGIGSIMGGRKADKEQDNLDEVLNSQIIGSVDQIGQHQNARRVRPGKGGADPNAKTPDGASEATLRAYLGMIGGPDVKDFLSKQTHVQSTQKLGNGNLGIVMSDGSGVVDTGVKYDPKTVITELPGQQYGTTSMVGGRGTFTPVTGFGDPGQGAPAPAADASSGQSAPAINPESVFQAVERVESKGQQSAVSPKGARGVMQLMPETAREMEKALGLPPGSTDTDENANRLAGRAYLESRYNARNGDLNMALMDYNWGMGNVDRWVANGADPTKIPAETRDYIRKIQGSLGGAGGGGGGTGAVAAPAGGGTVRIPTGAESEASKTRAKIETEASLALVQGQANATVKAMELDAAAAAEARKLTPKLESVVEEAEKAINQLKTHEGLDSIVGGGLIGRIPDNKAAKTLFNAVMAGHPSVGAMALHDQISGKVFSAAFETLKGGGQITEKEGEQAQAALARMNRAQSKKEYVAALDDFLSAIKSGLAKLKAAGAGQYAAPSAAPNPAPNRPALPPGFSWED